MENQKILKFMNDLDKFVQDTENKVPTNEKEVSADFIRVIEDLMKIDRDFNLDNMDLTKHIIINEDGTFLLSAPLKKAILK